MQHGGRLPHQLASSPPTSLAALLGATEAEAEQAADALLAAADASFLGSAAPPELAAVAYGSGSPTTGGLYRLVGRDAAGRTVSAFCKVVQHVRHWPGLVQLPPPIREQFAAELPWRTELELWDPLVQASLPGGLRSPRLLASVDLGDDRIAAWQEDVVVTADPWTTTDLARAARLLGRWNARCAEPDLLATSPYPANHALRMYGERSVPARGLAPLADDDLWSHPWLREHADLRAELRTLGARIPAMLERLDTLPQTLPHGDASPQNLLRPADGGDLVVIDLSFRTPHALGFDLGQLLVGLVHAGELPAARLPEITAAIVPAYLDGVTERLDVEPEIVVEGFTTSVLIRSAFDGFLYGLLAQDPSEETRAMFDERIAMSRFMLDQHRGITGVLSHS